MTAFDKFSLDDLKLVYRILYQALPDNMELVDSELFLQLQQTLHERARADIDLADHQQWEDWLNKQASLTRSAPRRRRGA